ncbi:MAG TPA: hypothetical protein VGM20_06705 [Gemmatimonadales bacterium]
MSGHVFHPDRDEWHGVTVVVSAHDGKTYLGRWHERGPRGVVMHDVAIHDPATASAPIDAWLAKQDKFGVAVTERFMIVPDAAVAAVRVFNSKL